MGTAKLLDSQWRSSYVTQRLKAFAQRCRERGMSVTPQRLGVIKALLTCENHPSAEEVFVRVRRHQKHISLATVHRILEQFCRVGEARKVTPLHDTARYDGHVEPHHHVVCVGCRCVRDVEIPEADRLLKSIPNLGEFAVLGGSLEVYALCAKCRSKSQKTSNRRNSRPKTKSEAACLSVQAT